MRRLWCVLPVITLGACLGVTATIPRRGSNEPTKIGVRVGGGPIGLTVLEVGIRNRLSHLRDEIPGRRAQLHSIPCGNEQCYSLEDVHNAIATIRSDAGAAFPEEALASRLTLDEELASVEDRIAVSRNTSSIYLVRNAQNHSAHVVSTQAANATFNRAKQPIDTYLAHRKLNPTVQFISEPNGAQFRMLIGTNESTVIDGWTKTEHESVWRGRYTLAINKGGYRGVSAFTVDLFRESGTTVRCRLVPNTASENDQSTCRLEH